MSSLSEGGVAISQSPPNLNAVKNPVSPSLEWDKSLTRGSSDSSVVECRQLSKRSKQRAAIKREQRNKLKLYCRLCSSNTRRSVKMSDNITTLGVLAHRGHDFCPYAAVAKYPYKYIDKGYMQTVSANFFAGGLLRARGWSL